MLALLAQATEDITSPAIDTTTNAAGAGFMAGLGIFLVAFWIIAVVLGIFSLWMFIDALIRKDDDFATGSKALWAILIFFLGFIPAILYFFMVKKKSGSKSGSTPSIQQPPAETPAA